MSEGNPELMMHELKARVMDALLELSAREDEARAADEILLADRIYDARSQLTDSAAILKRPDSLDAEALAEVGPISAAAVKSMSRLESALPAAGRLLMALRSLKSQAG